MDLGFEMWAILRYIFFSRHSEDYTDNQIKDTVMQVEPYGLYLSNFCKEEFLENVKKAFGTVYLGCIH